MYDKVTFFLCFSIIYTLNKDIIICSSEKSINKDHMHNKYINILVYVLLQKKYKQGSYAYVSIWIYKLYKYIGHIFMYVYSCVCVGICAYMYQFPNLNATGYLPILNVSDWGTSLQRQPVTVLLCLLLQNPTFWYTLSCSHLLGKLT